MKQSDLLNKVYAFDDLQLNYYVPGCKLIARERDDERGTWRKWYDRAHTPLERVLERPDEGVAPELKARLRAQADQLDALLLVAKEHLLQLRQTRSRAQQTAALTSEAGTAPPHEKQEAKSGSCTAHARTREEQRHERAAPSLRLNPSLRGSLRFGARNAQTQQHFGILTRAR